LNWGSAGDAGHRPGPVDLPTGAAVVEALRDSRIDFVTYNQVRSSRPMRIPGRGAVRVAEKLMPLSPSAGEARLIRQSRNLYATYPADFLDYVNAPIGTANRFLGHSSLSLRFPRPPARGAETTGVAIFDMVERKMKTASRTVPQADAGLVDPDNTRTQPAAVAASAGLDVLSTPWNRIPRCLQQRPKPPDRSSARRTRAQTRSAISGHCGPRIVNEFSSRGRDTSDDGPAMTRYR